jgi:hypothetical protein
MRGTIGLFELYKNDGATPAIFSIFTQSYIQYNTVTAVIRQKQGRKTNFQNEIIVLEKLDRRSLGKFCVVSE